MAIDKRKRKSKTVKTKTVFTDFSLKVLEHLKKRKFFKKILAPISQGKESVVFIAESNKGYVAIKIYRIENSDFNTMYNYIKFDPRFFRIPKQKRKVIFTWAQREFKNMQLAWKANISMPKPIVQKFNVLIMDYIGDRNLDYLHKLDIKDLNNEEIYNEDEFLHAPKLKNANLNKEEWDNVGNKLIKYMDKLYDKGLVHGDLSEYNVLYYKDEPYLIDFSHCTIKQNTEFDDLYERDKKNVMKFLNKKMSK